MPSSHIGIVLEAIAKHHCLAIDQYLYCNRSLYW